MTDRSPALDRRLFVAALLGAAGAAGSRGATAQIAPIDGRAVRRLREPVPTDAAPGQIEVIEFFWYGCPHCNALEATLEAWVRALPPAVVFRRVPVAFGTEPYVAHQRIYYALESMNRVDAMQATVFQAIHGERLRLDRPEQISAFVAAHGIDADSFMAAYTSFGTDAQLRRANRLVEAYGVDGVPSFGIDGRYYTSGALAGSNERALEAVDRLTRQLRK